MSTQAFATRLFKRLHDVSFDGVGISREAYGATESQALEVIEQAARALQIDTTRDAAGNLIATLAGTDPCLPYVAVGSHIDSVPRGGNYDGAAGIVAGLSLLRDLAESGVRPRRTVRLIALRGEESVYFGRGCIGAKALFGQLDRNDLDAPHVQSRKPLVDCMRDIRADVNRISNQELIVRPSDIACWFELHIEQGPVLDNRGLPIGVVTHICGSSRHQVVTCTGDSGHSGVVPRTLRRDAVFAVSDLIMRLDRLWQNYLDQRRDLVVTIGVLKTDATNEAITRIPDRVTFSFEVRSSSEDTIRSFHDLFLSECASVERARRVSFAADKKVVTPPAAMNGRLTERLKQAASDLLIPCLELVSGAGHDSSIFAKSGVPACMVFIRNQNGSHNPDESINIEDFVKGTEVLKHAVLSEIM